MNILTLEQITRIAHEVQPDMTLHPTTSAYATALVRPYAEPLENAQIDGIKLWLPQALPGELAKHANAEMTKAITKKTAELNAAAAAAKGVELLEEEEQYNETAPEVAAVGKEAVIEYIVAEIFELAGNYVRERYSTVIWPWDVQAAVGADEELDKMLGVTKDRNQLPVVVTVGPQKFTHNVTLEFVAGLVLFLDKSVGNHDFPLTLFDVPLAPATVPLTPEQDERFEFREDLNQAFSVVVKDMKYGFDTPDFMQGFATGAQWTKVDHHTYWKDLNQYALGDERRATQLNF